MRRVHAPPTKLTPNELIAVIMMLEQINIINLNVSHCAAAQNLLTQTAKERNADVVLLSEPYLPGVGNSGVLLDETGKRTLRTTWRPCRP